MSGPALNANRHPAAAAFRSIVVRYSLCFALLVVWQLAAMRAGSIFFPPPLELVQRAGELWLSGAPSALFLGTGVFNDILPSLARLLAGWSLAAAVGILVGVLIGR